LKASEEGRPNSPLDKELRLKAEQRRVA
jgi:hypothetical protein